MDMSHPAAPVRMVLSYHPGRVILLAKRSPSLSFIREGCDMARQNVGQQLVSPVDLTPHTVFWLP